MSKASGVLALIGGALAAVGVFLAWIDIGGLLVITGWEYFDYGGSFEELNFYMVPLIVLVLGVIAILLAGISLGGKTGGGSRLFFVIIGLALIVLPILFILDMNSGFFTTEQLMEILGIGFYMSLAGGLLVLVAAVIPNAK